LIDVGGQREQRAKWIEAMSDGVTAVIFLTDVSAYDMMLAEDHTVNRLRESINLLGQVWTKSPLRDKSIILFLNKQDKLEKKVREQRTLFENFFPEYAIDFYSRCSILNMSIGGGPTNDMFVLTRQSSFVLPCLFSVMLCSSKPREWSFEHKQSSFRYLCQSNAVSGTTKIIVSRQNLLDDSFNQVMKLETFELRRTLYVIFQGEEGLDYGGPAREWFFKLSTELLNPMYCLFQYASATNYSLQINPGSSVNPEHLQYFKFVGRFIALALYHNKLIDSGFTLPFYKRMLGKRITLEDLEVMDEVFYNSVKSLQETDFDEVDMELYFAADYDILGEVKSVDLKPGGSEIKVTEANKAEYLE
uniref:HECT-type E3 ubiquitin transferase n=1 Tax=Echinostoma caproni TaxID=27848 RepID=A0A183B0T6_9TREM